MPLNTAAEKIQWADRRTFQRTEYSVHLWIMAQTLHVSPELKLFPSLWTSHSFSYSKLSLTSSISISKIIYSRINSLIISLRAQHIKNPPAIKETQVWYPGWEDPLKEMTAHSSILAWKILCTEEPGGLQSKGSQRVRHNWTTKHTHCTSHFYSWFKTQPYSHLFRQHFQDHSHLNQFFHYHISS